MKKLETKLFFKRREEFFRECQKHTCIVERQKFCFSENFTVKCGDFSAVYLCSWLEDRNINFSTTDIVHNQEIPKTKITFKKKK